MDTAAAAMALIRRVRDRSWGLAVAALVDDDVVIGFDSGMEELTASTLFQIGSITKTMTGVLLADAVGRAELTLGTTVGDILGEDVGRCGAITMLELATQRSGLPRLPPNLRSDRFDRADPYAHYMVEDLTEALAALDVPRPGTYEYSNFGFMLLGVCLSSAAGMPFDDLMEHRLLTPLGMTGALCGTTLERETLPGYSGGQQVRWWHLRLAGPGGVSATIQDLVIYAQATLRPETTPIADAIRLATDVHADDPPHGLGWGHEGGGLWHNGGTAGFHSFVAVHRPTMAAVTLLANSGDGGDALDQAGFAVLTEMVKSRS